MIIVTSPLKVSPEVFLNFPSFDVSSVFNTSYPQPYQQRNSPQYNYGIGQLRPIHLTPLTPKNDLLLQSIAYCGVSQ